MALGLPSARKEVFSSRMLKRLTKCKQNTESFLIYGIELLRCSSATWTVRSEVGALVWGLLFFFFSWLFFDWFTEIMHSKLFFTSAETHKSGFDREQTNLVPETHILEITPLLLMCFFTSFTVCKNCVFFVCLFFSIFDTPIQNFGLP